jgi:hypothetical protein
MTDYDSTVPIKSPLALTGVFLDILRSRFSPDFDLPWKYLPGDEGRRESTIIIEAGGNYLVENPSVRPAIYVVRNPVSFGQVVIGDHFTHEQKHGSRWFYCVGQTSFTFSCEAESGGEAELISDIVMSTIMMGSDEIERTFGFRKLGPFSLSAEIKARQDVELYSIAVQTGLSYDVRWASWPAQPFLQEIIAKIKDSSYTNNDQYFTSLYLESLRQTSDSAP